VVAGEDVRALGHEVHAAEDDELALLALGGELRELVAVPAGVGELDDLLPLVVVPQDHHPVAERRPGAGDAGVQVRRRHADVLRRQGHLQVGDRLPGGA
jgi:hypothetical protein